MADDVVPRDQLVATLAELPDWRLSAGMLITAFAAPNAASALRLIASIGAAAESADHHPDVDWRYDHVFVTTTSHDADGQVTRRDVDLARVISELASAVHAQPKPDEARAGA